MTKTKVDRAITIAMVGCTILALLNLYIAPNKKEAVIVPTPTPNEQPAFDQLYPATAQSENGLVYNTNRYCRGLYSHIRVSYAAPNEFVILVVPFIKGVPIERVHLSLDNFPISVQQLYLSTGIRVRFQVKVESGTVYFRFLGLLAPPDFFREGRYQKPA